MSAQSVLLVGQPGCGGELADALGDLPVVSRTDAYQAIEEMSRQQWSAVLVSLPQDDLPGLCRAARRLQPHSALLAICPPAYEPTLRAMAGDLLDDYFVLPLTGGAKAGLRQRIDAGHSTASEGLDPQCVSALVMATRSPAQLEQCIAEIVSANLGAIVHWANASAAPSRTPPLLTLAGEPQRVLVCDDPAAVSNEAVEFLTALELCLPSLAAVASRTDSLNRLASTDHLTGAYNRRYFYMATERILRQAGQGHGRVSLLLYDIDDFKQYNDIYGYAVGDEILRQTAVLMRSVFRSHDLVARIGGDEFAVLFWDPHGPRLPDSKPIHTPLELADRFRKAISTIPFDSLGARARGRLTISGALAVFPTDGNDVRQLLRSADKALKLAKIAGKDAVQLVGG